MGALDRRLARLEGVMMANDSDLSDLSDIEIDLAHETVLRSIAENPETHDDKRQEARDGLAEIGRERTDRAAYLARPAVAAAIESNRAAGHIGAECACDALPYRHKSHRPVADLMARLVAWTIAREGAKA